MLDYFLVYKILKIKISSELVESFNIYLDLYLKKAIIKSAKNNNNNKKKPLKASQTLAKNKISQQKSFPSYL